VSSFGASEEDFTQRRQEIRRASQGHRLEGKPLPEEKATVGEDSRPWWRNVPRMRT
jgi:hypothetical protein